MKRVLLHIGPSKTGTTTIQAFLSEFAASLLAHGVYYPETVPPSNEGHPSLALEVRTASGEFVPPTTTPACSWSYVIDNFEALGADTLLLSSEDFSDLNCNHWEWVRDRLKDYEICVIFALRNPVDVVISAWKQSVKWGFGSGEEILDFDGASGLLMGLQRVAIFRLFDCINAGLRPVKICIFTIGSKMEALDLYKRFSLAAALPDVIAYNNIRPASRSYNESLSDWKTVLLLQLNQALFAHSPRDMTFPGNIGAARLELRSYILETLKSMPNTSNYKITISNDTSTKLLALQHQIMEWAASKELFGTSSDISESAQLKERASPTAIGDPTQPAGVDVINLLYKSFHNRLQNWTAVLDRANEYGSTQSTQVANLISLVGDMEDRLANLAVTLRNANEFGATQSANAQGLVKVITGMEGRIDELVKTLDKANEYGSTQSKNTQELIKILAEKDRQILDLKRRLYIDI